LNSAISRSLRTTHELSQPLLYPLSLQQLQM
jgi:hypothetical protein